MTKAEKIALGKKILTDEKSDFLLTITADRNKLPHLYLCEPMDENSTRIISYAELDLTDIYVQIAELAEKAVEEIGNGKYELKPFGLLDDLQHGRS